MNSYARNLSLDFTWSPRNDHGPTTNTCSSERATTNAASTTTAETETKTSNETEEKLVYYILFDCLPSDEWGSFNDNVLSALPWVRRHHPWWNKLLGIHGPSSGRHGREVLLAAHFGSVLCVVLHFTWLSNDMNSYLISIHMSYEFIRRIRTAYLWQITWIGARQMVISTIRIRTQFVLQHKIRSFRNYGTYVGEERNFSSSPATAKITKVGLQLHFGWAHVHPGNHISNL